MRLDAPTAWAMEACCCAPTLGYGSTFPFVQYKPLGIGERIRAVLSDPGCQLDSGSQHGIVQGNKPWEAQTSGSLHPNLSAWMLMLDGANAPSV